MALTNIWDERFGSNEYIYGTEPNDFFKSVIDTLPAGSILLPCEGEGRNSVYAAKKGWDVNAFDGSKEGMKKAFNLAKVNKVNINYNIMFAEDYQVVRKYHAIGLIYSHFRPEIRTEIHDKLVQSLETGGTIILEAFNKRQINNNTGGPKDIEMLYSYEMLKNDFSELKFELLEETSVILDEGNLHSGSAEVIRMIAIRH